MTTRAKNRSSAFNKAYHQQSAGLRSCARAEDTGHSPCLQGAHSRGGGKAQGCKQTLIQQCDSCGGRGDPQDLGAQGKDRNEDLEDMRRQRLRESEGGRERASE